MQRTHQLPGILTPRTLRRSRPYLINQFTRILSQLNQDISSDSDDEGGPKFGIVALNAPSRNIVRWWLAQARRRLRLREVVQPLINKARGAQCEVGLWLVQLIPILLCITNFYHRLRLFIDLVIKFLF